MICDSLIANQLWRTTTKPLDALRGANKPPSQTKSWFGGSDANPLYHEYICIVTGGGAPECAGLSADHPFLWGPGKRKNDPFNPKRCKKKDDDNECLEKCLRKKFLGPYPNWALLGPMTPLGLQLGILIRDTSSMNCQMWAHSIYEQCKTECSQ